MVKINSVQIKNPSRNQKKPEQSIQNAERIKSLEQNNLLITQTNPGKNNQHNYQSRIIKLISPIDLWILEQTDKKGRRGGGRLLTNSIEDWRNNEGNQRDVVKLFYWYLISLNICDWL